MRLSSAHAASDDARQTASAWRSGLYAGRVTHRRLCPRRHALDYRVFYLLLDLDELGALERGLRLFARDRFHLLAFHERDHGDGSGPLRPQVEAMVAAAGGPASLGAIRLLCLPRLLGHVFNPLSVYFCHDRAGRLAALVYEVSNTFGQRHSYVIPVAPGAVDTDGTIRQRCGKRFYVSPFLDMDLTYDFAIQPPGEAVGIAVTARDAEGAVLATAFAGVRRALTDAALAGAILTHPLLTLKVIVGIHWEALRIWLKGIRLRPRPPAPAHPMTAVPPSLGPIRPAPPR